MGKPKVDETPKNNAGAEQSIGANKKQGAEHGGKKSGARGDEADRKRQEKAFLKAQQEADLVPISNVKPNNKTAVKPKVVRKKNDLSVLEETLKRSSTDKKQNAAANKKASSPAKKVEKAAKPEKVIPQENEDESS